MASKNNISVSLLATKEVGSLLENKNMWQVNIVFLTF